MEDKNSRVSIGWFIIPSILILSLSIIYPFFIKNWFCSWSERGTFGDSFGMLNALFSGLAFAGVIYTVIAQQKELELTRNELIKSANAQIEAQKALKKQVEVQTLTTLLEAHTSLFKHHDEQMDLDDFQNYGEHVNRKQHHRDIMSKIINDIDSIRKESKNT